jgi:Flp pilus assembly protein TadD
MWQAQKDHVRQANATGQALKLQSDHAGILLAHLNALLNAGQYDQVLQLVAANRERKDIESILLACQAAAQAGLKQPEAMDTFQQAFDSAPFAQVSEVAKRMRETLGDQQYMAVLKQWSEARPTVPVLLLLGQQYLQSQQWALGRDAFQAALDAAQDEPLKGFLASQLGMALNMMGEYAQARDAYLLSVKFNPNDERIRNNLAYLLANDLNDPKAALEHARLAVRLAPTNYNIVDTLGWVLFLNGELAEAEKTLQRSIQLKQASGNRYHLGRTLEGLNRPSEARQQYQLGFDLIRNDPQDAFYAPLKERLDALK